MTPPDIQKSVVAWLRAQSLEVEIVSEFEIYVTLCDKYGNWPCAIFCEENPTTICYLARLPGTIPEAKLNWMSLNLHDFNRRIRFGRFSLDSKKRTISFRYTSRLVPNIPLDLQVNEAMHIIDYQMKTLGRLFIMVMKKTTEAFQPSTTQYEI